MAKIIKIDKQQWRENFGRLSGTYRVIGPREDDGGCEFRELAEGELPDLGFANTRRSPKAAVFPQTEIMLKYSLDGNDPEKNIMKPVTSAFPSTAVVGIRPCDARALSLVRLNFDTPEYRDPYWLGRYENTVFVGLACETPGPVCFCTSTGGGPYDETGLDILLSDRGDFFLAKVLSDNGEKFLKTAGWDMSAEDEKDFDASRETAEGKIVSHVSTDRLAEKSLLHLHAAPFWDNIAFACINCGTCTYVCPTCWCFDIQDETYGKKGVRMRNWDSCMFPLFTMHTTGHNPRGEKVQRVRQRFMHKLKYFVDKYGQGVMCTGCGRCVRSCPVNIDIRTVCERMNDYTAETESA